MPAKLDVLLNHLESAKNTFGRGSAGQIKRLLRELSHREFHDADLLIRFHEALLFLRAFPQSASLVPMVEKLLDTFHDRVEGIRAGGADMSVFDDFDTSGIAGTTMQDTLSFEAARWLARRIPRNVEIAWDDYDDERAMGSTWPRFIPLLEEDSDVEANIPWRRWFDTARGRERDLQWLIRQFEDLAENKGSNPQDRRSAELYDSLRLPLRWRLGNLKLSRTRNWRHPRQIYFHTAPLISRKEVSLSQELARRAPRFTRLSSREGEAVMQMIREVMVVRYRELYGTTLGDARSVVRFELGRGIVIYLWNLPASRRLPLRAYVAGFTLKNGVPVNYVEAIGLCEWIEIGFNTFYTYRQGETAWIYAQALRCICALTGATTISVYPYQIGQNNDEALDSGAFWFYRKLGFRSGSPLLERAARSEEKKIAANALHRTSRPTLKRLAGAHMFYELAPTDADKDPSRRQTAEKATAASADPSPGPWDTFSTRNLGLRVNRRMQRKFGGDSGRIRDASVAKVARALNVNYSRWTAGERRSLESWSLVLAMIPKLANWTAEEKRRVIAMIRSQPGPNEMKYLRLTQSHARLREELLRLGSSESRLMSAR